MSVVNVGVGDGIVTISCHTPTSDHEMVRDVGDVVILLDNTWLA